LNVRNAASFFEHKEIEIIDKLHVDSGGGGDDKSKTPPVYKTPAPDGRLVLEEIYKDTTNNTVNVRTCTAGDRFINNPRCTYCSKVCHTVLPLASYHT